MRRIRTKDEKKMVHPRLPQAMVKAIDHLAIDADCTREEIVERLLGEALAARKELEGMRSDKPLREGAPS